MSGNWCTWCKLNQKEWTNHGHEKGVEWTLAAMNALREKLNMYEITDTPMNRKGVVDVILFESVSIRLYIYSILHSEIGLGNFVLNLFFLWVDYRIENITEEEIEKRQLFATLITDVETKETQLDEYNNSNDGRELIDLKLERSELKEVKGFKNDDGTFVD